MLSMLIRQALTNGIANRTRNLSIWQLPTCMWQNQCHLLTTIIIIMVNDKVRPNQTLKKWDLIKGLHTHTNCNPFPTTILWQGGWNRLIAFIDYSISVMKWKKLMKMLVTRSTQVFHTKALIASYYCWFLKALHACHAFFNSKRFQNGFIKASTWLCPTFIKNVCSFCPILSSFCHTVSLWWQNILCLHQNSC